MIEPSDLAKIEILLRAIAEKLGADLSPLDVCECGHRRYLHSGPEHGCACCRFDGSRRGKARLVAEIERLRGIGQ